MSKEHKKDWGPGYRFFSCEACGTNWKEKSRDCTSPSGEICPDCNEFEHPIDSEPHYEWSTDKHGNLLEEK